ncbi:MAG: DUF6088 family protein [Candidatus Electrothrix scaldis]|nr:MAG: DUF6088 family protein [Candidatus Electrothrix sp. GW3-3]
MKVSEYVRNTIDRFPNGYIFTSVDFTNKVNNGAALIKALNRLAASGRIVKLTKGKYYKPEKSPFGDLPPDQYQVVKDLLERDGKVVGYLTGLSIYNKLGLTTQVGSTIQIGKQEIRSPFTRGKYTISFVKQKNIITKENTPLLQLLDVLRYIKKIPDAKPEKNIPLVKHLLSTLSDQQQETMVRLALKYPPSTRALLGAVLSDMERGNITENLKKSLNPITVYNIPGASTVLCSASEWGIR